ncbi:hypothetical protein Y032_0061g3222 [Ancylostoma ceylanicum]|uniref:Uncharacterized protein n=1 Tax=Ancylostoma ceylanicum TaxID=53326 RepID=A0A016U2M3_9BILA|nr:hypothetical protein Y032_0061g3222 [Ancylostoma ceylanicum]
MIIRQSLPPSHPSRTGHFQRSHVWYHRGPLFPSCFVNDLLIARYYSDPVEGIRLYTEMKALIFILACCGMATSAKCPKTSELTKSDYDNSQDVTTAKVLSKKESGNPLEYKLNHETYIKLYSYDYFYVPETIKIPKNCNTTLKVGEKYVMGFYPRITGRFRIKSTVGFNGGDPSAASKITRRDRAAQARIFSGTLNYGVFLIVS